MGFSLKRTLRSGLRNLPGLVAGFAAGGPAGLLTAGSGLLTQRLSRPVGGGVSALMTDSGVPIGNGGGTMPVAVPMAIAAIAGTVFKLAQRLGIALQPTAASVASVGRRMYLGLSNFAAKHPAVSLGALLLSLGLSADEAAQFLGWGAVVAKKKRRARGISARDFRTTRRTVRKIVRMAHDLRSLGSGAPRAARRLPAHQHRIVSS